MNPSVQWEQDLAAKDHEYYQQLYQYEGEGKSKQDIELFLLKAKQIPRQQLNQIIGAAYQSNGSNLDNKKSFFMALKLIACAQSNQSPSTPILSTDTPLPSFDDYDFISTKDRQKYIRIFHAAGPSNGYLSGQDAMKILMRSKLPVGLLSQIWNLSDIREEGKLDVHGFIIAMHYVAKCMNGNTTLPETKVPRSILLSAFADNPQLLSSLNISQSTTEINGNSTNIATTSVESPVKNSISSDENQLFSPIYPSSPWIINNNEYSTYVNAFKSIDTQNQGYIEGGQAVGFFNHSDLPPSDLANIWDLADTQNSGKLNVGEFAIAMHLIRRLRGGSTFSSFPSSLHDTLLSQIHAKPEQLSSSIESHESLKARTIELQNNINKEQSVITGLNNEIQKKDDVLNTLRETVKTLEDTLQQTISQKIELQNLLGSMKKSEMEKRHKIAILEKEYNNNQSEIKSLKAAHQQQLVFSSVSDRQLEAAQQQRDRSVEDLALAQDGQFDKLSDPSPPVIKQNIPKPPPPSSRHHRTPSVRNSSNATSTRKPPAPPPSKKNRASVVMASPSSVVSTNNILTTDKSIKEEESENKNENETFSSSAIEASTISAIASSNVNMDSVISSAVAAQKEQDFTEPLSVNQEIVPSSQSESVQSNPSISNVIDSTQQHSAQPVDSESEKEDEDEDDEDEDDEDDEDDTSSDTSSEAEAPSQSSEIAAPEAAAAAAAAVTPGETSRSTPITNQNKTESNNIAKTKENDGDVGDDKSLRAAPYEAITQDCDANMKDMTNAKKGSSHEIKNEAKKDDQIQQDIAKATTEDITNNNDSSIENDAKNNITDDHVDSIVDERNKDTIIMGGNVTKEQPLLNKDVDQVEPSSVNSDDDGDDTNIQPSITPIEQEKQRDDDNNKKTKDKQIADGGITVYNINEKSQSSGDSNKISSIEDKSPESTTSTKGEDHDDFEVLENTSTSSSFMSASMGMDDDAIDEFDAAFAETLPDAKVITSNTNTNNNNNNNNNNTPITTTATALATTNNQQPSEKINESLSEDNFYDEDDFDKAFGNKELKPVSITAAASQENSNNKGKDNIDNHSTTTTTQDEPIQKNDPFWVDESSSVKNAFEDSFTSTPLPLSSNNNEHKTDLTFGDAFTTTPSGFNDTFTSSNGFGDSFTTTVTTPAQQPHNFENNDTTIKNVHNTNEANNNEFSSTNEFSEMLDQHKAFNSQSPFNNPFEEFAENNNSSMNEITNQQQHQRDPSIKEDNVGYTTNHNNKVVSNETVEDRTKPTEPTTVSPITTSSVVPNNTQSTGSSTSVPQQQQQSTKRSEDDHSTPTAKGKKGKFSLSSMLPKQKGKKSKSKLSKKEKEAVSANKNHHDPSTATLSSLHSNNSRHTNDFLETSLPQLTEQEVMANLREFGNDTESVTTIVNMGFTVDQAKEALKRYDYDVEKALNFLLDQ